MSFLVNPSRAAVIRAAAFRSCPAQQVAGFSRFALAARPQQQALLNNRFAPCRSFSAKISMDLIKKLRVRANAGVMECKSALQEAGKQDGINAEDENQLIRAAMDILRQRGIAKAGSKADREANEGLVSLIMEGGEDNFGTRASLIELNCETDFVSHTENFRAFVTQVNTFAHAMLTGEAAKTSAEEFNGMQVPAEFPEGNGHSVKDYVSSKVIEFGENINLRKVGTLEMNSPTGILAYYVHNKAESTGKAQLGRTAGVIGVDAPSLDQQKLKELAKTLAIHVVAGETKYMTREEVPAADIEHEKDILIKQAQAAGEDKFLDKKIEGRLRKYFEEICLMEQAIIAPEFSGSKAPSVQAYLAEKGGKDAKITGFLRFEVGV